MTEELPYSVFLIRNTSTEKKLLIDFIIELREKEPLVDEYFFQRLWTDTYGILPREYNPGETYEVKFTIDVCILGRMMNRIAPSGILSSFSYVKIKDNEGYFSPTGERMEDPHKRAVREAKEFLDNGKA